MLINIAEKIIFKETLPPRNKSLSRIMMCHCFKKLLCALIGAQCWGSTHKLIKDDSKTIDIHKNTIKRLSSFYFWWEIIICTNEALPTGRGIRWVWVFDSKSRTTRALQKSAFLGRNRFCCTKIDESDIPVFRNQNILQFYVPMGLAKRVHLFDRLNTF